MIVKHQTNIAAFAGNHVQYWAFQLPAQQISSTTGGVPGPSLISQIKGMGRFVSARIFGRIN
jgi:hypothetical protein